MRTTGFFKTAGTGRIFLISLLLVFIFAGAGCSSRSRGRYVTVSMDILEAHPERQP